MGGFFIYNRSAGINENIVKSVFSARGLSRWTAMDADEARVLYFSKIQDSRVLTIQNGGLTAVAAGTLIYKTLNRQNSLTQVVADITGDRLDPRELSGTFNLIIVERHRIRMWCDAAGLYHTFYRSDGHAISSSFTAILKSASDDHPLDRFTVVLNLALGYWPGDRTFSEKIHRITPGNMQSLSLSFPFCGDVFPRQNPAYDVPEADNLESHAAMQNDCLFRHIQRFRSLCDQGAYLGLSGGYDSRLLALMLQRSGISFRAFTHWKRGIGTDQAIAEDLARHMEIPLEAFNSSRFNCPESPEKSRILQEAFEFFDGRVHHAMEYQKYEYTPAYRMEVQSDAAPVFSGTGGEIFRNHNAMPRSGAANMEDWLWYYVSDYLTFASIRSRDTRRRVIAYLRNWIAESMGLSDSRRIPFAAMRRYYSDIWLKDWFGLRNTVENQYSEFVAPFAETRITETAHGSMQHIGWNGTLEAEMIRQLDPAIAAMPSSYGYPLTQVPKLRRLRTILRCVTPPAWKLTAGVVRQAVRKKTPLIRHPDVAGTPILRRAAETMYDLKLPIDLDILARSREKKVLILSLGYALEKHATESRLRC